MPEAVHATPTLGSEFERQLAGGDWDVRERLALALAEPRYAFSHLDLAGPRSLPTPKMTQQCPLRRSGLSAFGVLEVAVRYLRHPHDWRPTPRRANRQLYYAGLLYAIGIAVHTADHFRRGTDVLTPQVYWAGLLSTAVALAAISLVVLDARPAPAVAASVGFANAIGVAAVHLLPSWSAFSDAFPGGAVDSQSWVAVLLEIATAVLFGVAGLHALGNEQTDSRNGVSRRPGRMI